MPTIHFMFFDAGGGHRAAATALKQVIEQQARPWTVRLVHLQEILDKVDVFKKLLRIDLQEIYNQMLRRGWTYGSEPGLRFMQQVIRFYHGAEVRLLREFWRANPADMMVSLIPNFNRAMTEAFHHENPGKPYVTIPTDLADFPPRFWMEEQATTTQPQYVICGTPKCVSQARDRGFPNERVFGVPGMILNPRFYGLPPVDRAAVRAEMGLDADCPTGLVLFGGFGSWKMREIVERIDAGGRRVQLILIAGRNERLRAALAQMRTRTKTHVVGFTNEVPRYMQAADFFIGKPGPGSVSEAIHLGLPVITTKNSWTLPQERFNADWLEEIGAGLKLESFDGIADAVGRMLEPGELDRMRAAAARQQFQAVWEIPDILERLLGSPASPPRQPIG